MGQRDLTAFFGKTLDYPGVPSTAHPGGKTYKVPSPDAKTGLWLTALADAGIRAARGLDVSDADAQKLQLDDDEERTLMQRVLGPVYDEMLADGVAWADLQLVGQDAYLSFSVSEAFADSALAVESGNLPARANRATRRATGPKTAGSNSGRASTGTPARTRSRASTRSSTSPTGLEDVPAAV